jgi:hypothetical protein
MAVKVRGKRDPYLDQFVTVLEQLVADRPETDVALYRRNPASVRIRVIDPGFRRMSDTKRDDLVWKYLERLPEDVLFHVSLVLTFTPEEAKDSPLNHDFEHPIPMRT